MKKIKLSDFDLLRVGNTVQLVGGIWAGDGECFLSIFPGENIENQELILLPMDNADWEKFLRQSDLKEVEILERGPKGIIKAVVRKSQRQIDTHLQWRVFKRDGYQCRYCGREIPLSVDHIDLWESGGATIEENLLAACKSCNRTRGKTPYEKWIKSEKYERISRNLTDEQRRANINIIEKLAHLKTLRVRHIRSR